MTIENLRTGWPFIIIGFTIVLMLTDLFLITDDEFWNILKFTGLSMIPILIIGYFLIDIKIKQNKVKGHTL